MTEERPKGKPRPNYTNYAFTYPYNLMVLCGLGIVALATGNWFLLMLVACTEALWMLFAPDSELLKKLVWDPQFREEQLELAQAQALEDAHNYRRALDRLDEDRKRQVCRLERTRDDILRLSSNNPGFAEDLLREELGKVGTLFSLYVEMMLTSERYENYLRQVDLRSIELEIRQLEGALKGPTGDIARKNLNILERRKAKLREIQDYLVKAEAQMGLIESTFLLLADQVVTLRSPHELGSQLDELIDGVEAVRETSRETEKILRTEAA